MRFLFISSMNASPWGGSEELWSQAAIRLSREGHSVSVSVRRWARPSPKLRELVAAGVTIRQRSMSYSALLWRKGLDVLRLRAFAFLMDQRTRPDLVIISQGSSWDGLEWMEICGQLKIPFAPIIHCNHDTNWTDDALASRIAAAFRAAQKTFYVSENNIRLLECQIGTTVSSAARAWNPFNVARSHALTWPSNNKQPNIACVARLEPNAKGQDLLLQVLANPKWRDRSVTLNLFGDGPSANTVQRLAQTLCLENVIFNGHVERITDIWETNHLLILPSRREGLPISLVEAMWCGRPAVVTDVGGNSELCIDGETGFVAQAPSVGLIDDALERAWQCRNDWPEIGSRARRRIQELMPDDPVGDFCVAVRDLC